MTGGGRGGVGERGRRGKVEEGKWRWRKGGPARKASERVMKGANDAPRWSVFALINVDLCGAGE